MTGLQRVGDVAEMTGVSIRTLHHDDRIGLLRPACHSEGGHRLYSEAELLRLRQILTPRYLGFPLRLNSRVIPNRRALPRPRRAAPPGTRPDLQQACQSSSESALRAIHSLPRPVAPMRQPAPSYPGTSGSLC